MPRFTVCYTRKVEGTIFVEAEDLDDAKARVERMAYDTIAKEGSEQYDDVSVEDGWEI